MLSAIGANIGAIFASFAASQTDYRTIGAQKAIRAEVSACAVVAYSTVNTKAIVTIRTMFSAIGTKNGAPFATAAIDA